MEMSSGILAELKRSEFYRHPMLGCSMKVDKGPMTPLGHDTQGMKTPLQRSKHQEKIFQFHNSNTKITEIDFMGKCFFLGNEFLNKDDNDPG